MPRNDGHGVDRSNGIWHLTLRVRLEEDPIMSDRKPIELHMGTETLSAGYPDAQSRSGVVDRAAMTWAARSAEQNACIAEVSASDLSVAKVGAVDTEPSSAAAAGSKGTASTVPSSSEELFSSASLYRTACVGTAPLVADMDACADDGVAAHGRSIVVESVAAWAAHSVEQDAGTMVLEVSGAPGLTVRGSPMAGAKVGESYSPADAVRSPVALATEHDAGDAALVPMGTICVTANGIAVVGAEGGGGRRQVSRISSHILLISALHSSR
jgi:hypothetical protein